MKKILLAVTLFALTFVFLPKSNNTTPAFNYDNMIAENQRLAVEFEEDKGKLIQNEKSMQENIKQYQSDQEKIIQQETNVKEKMDEIYNQINSVPK